MTHEKINAVIREKAALLLAGNPNPTTDEIRGLVGEIADGLLAENPELAPRVKVVECDPEARTVTAEILGIPQAIVLNQQEA